MSYEDIPEVLRIERVCFSTPWSGDMFEAEIEGPVSYATVAEHDDRVVAYATYRIILDECHLMNIAVSPEYRRDGVGRELLQYVVDHCRSRGAEYMFLEVRRSNRAAQALYAAFGFHRLGVRRGYYTDNKEDALILKLDFPKEDEPLAGEEGEG
jgi:ribosomal-protein-alanine N-acetyltransferase